ncbi:hypothetical protein [Rhodococcus sp. NBC_00297]|uniref:hypothetical protein n=1 Tax=Rhodococcus sp. NBC_00297 TaxID=2976005 RepID=UPI002E28934D|nr:hypothetical protein [Rhodococcus sp. NBC_00297]
MKNTVAVAVVTLVSAAMVMGCSDSGTPEPSGLTADETYDELVALWEQSGRLMRPCEVDKEDKQCQFAVRDAIAATGGTMGTLRGLEVPEAELGMFDTILDSMIGFERECFPELGYVPSPGSQMSYCTMMPAGEWMGEVAVKELQRLRALPKQ